MQLHIESIEVVDHILIYSKFTRDTVTLDEDGVDVEYDFNGVYNNLDDIQKTIVRLYGTQGLITIYKYFAEGRDEGLKFNPIEFEESSSLKEQIDKLFEERDTVKEKSLDDDIRENKIPLELQEKLSDDIFILEGMIEGLTYNDDLNVMKLMGEESDNVDFDSKEILVGLVSEFGIEKSEVVNYFKFNLNGEEKIMLITHSAFYVFVKKNEEFVMIYPTSKNHLMTNNLFHSYVRITKSTRLKKSVIFEIDFNQLAKQRGSSVLKQYFIHFNLESVTFESKENRLTV